MSAVSTAARPSSRSFLARFLPAGMLGREWLATIAQPRALVVRSAMPLALTVPLVTGHAPSFWAGMLLTVLVAMVGAVGSGVAAARARGSGLLLRLAVVPRPAHRIVGDWVVAAATVDCVQLLPAVAAVVARGDAGPADAAALVAAVLATLLLANTLGCVLARLAGGAGEVLLDVAVVLAPLLFLGGLFTGVPTSGWRHWAAVLDPFTYLHSAFVAALGGTPDQGPGTICLAALIWVVASLMGLAASSRIVLDRA
jgi:hypothetical protein